VSSTNQTYLSKGTYLRLKQGTKDKSKLERGLFLYSVLKRLFRAQIPTRTHVFLLLFTEIRVYLHNILYKLLLQV
jgi:hypothetical protein